MAAPKAGRDTRIGIAQQSTFGTAIADASAFNELYVEATEMKQDIKVREIPGNHASRQILTGDQSHDTKGAMPMISLAGEVSRNDFDLLLYAAMQSVTEGGSTPFAKTFVLGSTQPDFGANAGFFATLIDRFPDASRSHKMVDAIVKSLGLSLEAGDRLKFSADMVGRGAISATSNPSGTWTAQTYAPYHFEDIGAHTVDFGSGAQALTLKKYDAKIENEIVAIGGASSTFGVYGIPKRSGSLDLSVLYDETQYASAKTAAEAGTLCTHVLRWGNATPGTTNGDLAITLTFKIEEVTLDKADILYFNMKGKLFAASASASFATIVLANAIDRAW